MSRIGILEPTGLLGRELREQLEALPELASDLRLYSQRDEGVGTLTEVAGSAAVVQPLSDEELEGLDLLFVCEPRPEELAALLDRLPSGSSVIVVAPTTAVAGGRPLIVDESGDEPARGEILISPHPAAVGLTLLLRPLRELGLEDVVATLLRPVSMYDQEALEEVFGQTRDLLEFRTPEKSERFAQQVAFNLLPGPPEEAAVIDQLAALLPEVPIAVHSLQAGVFHGLSMSVFCQLGSGVELEDVTAALTGYERLELAEAPDEVGPVEAAKRNTLLIGEVRSAPGRPGAFWLWATFDNLTRGGASNAVEIAQRLLG